MRTRFVFQFSLLVFLIVGGLSIPVSAQTEAQNLEPHVFPNFGNGEEAIFSLKGFEAEDLLIVVYDMLGNEMYSRVEISENGGILISGGSEGYRLHPGMYLIVASKNDAVFKQKLIVRS